MLWKFKVYSVLLVNGNKVTYIKLLVASLIIHIIYDSTFWKSPVKNNEAGKDKWNNNHIQL